MEHLGRLAEKSLTVKLNRLVAEGDTAIALTEVTAGGESGDDADVIVLRNGKTVRVEAHGDTAMISAYTQEAARHWITAPRNFFAPEGNAGGHARRLGPCELPG